MTWLLLLAGAVLRLWQYLANSSLWIDELALARNIIDRPAAALLGPLDYAQVAPVGFLLAEKTITAVAGSSGEYALRAFPLACGLASLVLFRAVARRVLTGWGVPFAVGLFALGIPFIYFSSQVKQYSSDVAVALGLALAALEIRRRGVTINRAVWLGLGGALLAWFSQPALIVLAGIGGALLILALQERDRAAIRALSITWLLWGASAAAVAVHSMHNVSPLDREYFRWFWAEGFMPLPPHSLSDLLWLPGKFLWVFGAFAPGLGHTHGGMNYRWSPVFAVMMLYGFWVLWRRRREVALLLLLPVVAAVGLSAASVYPFTARLLAFLTPVFLLATAAGASHFLTRLPAGFQFLTPVTLALLGGAPLYAVAGALPPSWVQHMRPVLAHVRQHYVTGDRIYVYSGAGLAFGYYAPRLDIPDDGVVLGRCALADPREYFREIDRLRGEKRIWFVATHEQRNGELNVILGYLDRIGRRLDTVVAAATNGRVIENAYGYLYDLSDRTRPTSAETYALPPTFTPLKASVQRWGCYGITGGEPSPLR